MCRLVFTVFLGVLTWWEAILVSCQLLPSTRFCGMQQSDGYVRKDIQRANVEEYPWLVGLIYQFDDGEKALLCSGTLIHERYVVTAAHCIALPKKSELTQVRLGAFHISDSTYCGKVENVQEDICPKVVDYGIETKIIHPDFNVISREHDIALLRLNATIEWSDFVRPICLYKGTSKSKPGDILFTSGFGRNKEGGAEKALKKKIRTEVISTEDCSQKFPNTIRSSQICTNDVENNIEWKCTGDGGTPLMQSSGRLQWRLEGIASWSSGCGPNEVHVYTRVPQYVEWIEAHIVQ